LPQFVLCSRCRRGQFTHICDCHNSFRQTVCRQTVNRHLTAPVRCTDVYQRMYYGSGTGGRCCICAGQTLRVRSPDGSTYLREMTTLPPSWKSHQKYDSLIRRVFTRRTTAKFRPDPIWKYGAMGFFEAITPRKTRNRTTTTTTNNNAQKCSRPMQWNIISVYFARKPS